MQITVADSDPSTRPARHRKELHLCATQHARPMLGLPAGPALRMPEERKPQVIHWHDSNRRRFSSHRPNVITEVHYPFRNGVQWQQRLSKPLVKAHRRDLSRSRSARAHIGHFQQHDHFDPPDRPRAVMSLERPVAISGFKAPVKSAVRPLGAGCRVRRPARRWNTQHPEDRRVRQARFRSCRLYICSLQGLRASVWFHANVTRKPTTAFVLLKAHSRVLTLNNTDHPNR